MAGLCPILAAVKVFASLSRCSCKSFSVIFRKLTFIHSMLTVGTEWLIEASGCDAAALRDVVRLREVFARAVAELDLRIVGEQFWHKFPGEGGATGLAMLTESHLACHTYPEFRVATFNLYCCRERPAWPWDERLREMLGATAVSVRAVRREPPATLESAHTSVGSVPATPESTHVKLESVPATLEGTAFNNLWEGEV
jgi:S-adenosylmethionine decarboxylase